MRYYVIAEESAICSFYIDIQIDLFKYGVKNENLV